MRSILDSLLQNIEVFPQSSHLFSLAVAALLTLRVVAVEVNQLISSESAAHCPTTA